MDYHFSGSKTVYLNNETKNELNQKWFLDGSMLVSKGIKNTSDERKCLQVYGAVVGVWSKNNGSNQVWTSEGIVYSPHFLNTAGA